MHIFSNRKKQQQNKLPLICITVITVIAAFYTLFFPSQEVQVQIQVEVPIQVKVQIQIQIPESVLSVLRCRGALNVSHQPPTFPLNMTLPGSMK